MEFSKGTKEQAKQAGQTLAKVFTKKQLKTMRRHADLTYMYAILYAGGSCG